MALQGDGKVVIAGSFVSVDGVANACIARLNADGGLDTTFNPGSGANDAIYSMVLQGDGKVVIAGTFTSVNGVGRYYLARLNVDGSLDTAFNPSGLNNAVFCVAAQPDGKLLISGYFSSINGVACNGFARLNADGSLDASFNPGNAPNGSIECMAVQGDGKVLIGGYFGSVGGVTRNGLARLNRDGSLDGVFNPDPGTGSEIRSLAVQTDGKVAFVGSFTTVNGVARKYIARVNANGSLDTLFNSSIGADSSVYSVSAQTGGKVIVGGDFTKINGVARRHIARLNTDGSLDTTFNPGSGTDYSVYSLVTQPDGKAIIGGNFYFINNMWCPCVARLNADGSPDATFVRGNGPNRSVNSMAVQPDGKLIIGGNFNAIGATLASCVARLNVDGSQDTTFSNGGFYSGIYSVALQPDGKALIGGNTNSYPNGQRGYVARLNSNGSLDTTFNSSSLVINSAPGHGDSPNVYSVVVQPDGKVLIGGSFGTINGYTLSGIARLNSDGSLDTTFDPGSGVSFSYGGTSSGPAYVYSVVVQPDGKVLIGGGFTKVNGVPRYGIARLKADGSLDTAFNPTGATSSSVYSIALQTDGKIVMGGGFASVNSVARKGIARLNADGSLDTTFDPGNGANYTVASVATQTDGKIVIGGAFTSVNNVARNYIARLKADGSLDTAFDPGSGTSYTVSTVATQTDGKVFIGGGFTSVNGVNINYLARLYGNTIAAAPAATSSGADTLKSASAVVRASVNPQGSATSVSFQYGPTISYGITTATQSIGAGGAPVAVSTTLSGLSPSTLYHYRAVSANSVGTTYVADATFTTVSVVQDWQQQYFGLASNPNAADAADPDGDGISNLLERALGLDPTQAGTAGLPTTARDPSTGRLILTTSKGGYSSDLVFSAEASSDLLKWNTSDVTILVNTATAFQARDDGPAGDRRFLRLRVTNPSAPGRPATSLSATRR